MFPRDGLPRFQRIVQHASLVRLFGPDDFRSNTLKPDCHVVSLHRFVSSRNKLPNSTITHKSQELTNCTKVNIWTVNRARQWVTHSMQIVYVRRQAQARYQRHWQSRGRHLRHQPEEQRYTVQQGATTRGAEVHRTAGSPNTMPRSTATRPPPCPCNTTQAYKQQQHAAGQKQQHKTTPPTDRTQCSRKSQ